MASLRQQIRVLHAVYNEVMLAMYASDRAACSCRLSRPGYPLAMIGLGLSLRATRMQRLPGGSCPELSLHVPLCDDTPLAIAEAFGDALASSQF